MHKNNLFESINGYPLDEQQIKAATCQSKYSMIIAGAGSGKSTTMVGKIKYLVNYLNVNQEQILCISFTNESANNLKNNITKNCNLDIDVKTFHKLAMDILKDNKIKFNLCTPLFIEYIVDEYFRMLDDNVKIKVICFLKGKYFAKNNNTYEKLKQTKEFDDFKHLVLRFLSLYRSHHQNDEYLKELFYKSKNYKETAFYSIIITVYKIYEIEKKSQGLMDFDDIIVSATNLTNKGGNIKPYKYIIIDEFQDTSPIRFNLIKSIIKRNKSNLTVIGDDFQSIYQFSGCNLELFLDFQEIFPDTEILRIEKTYRNSEELIKVAGNFVMRNPKQMIKNLKSDKHKSKPIKIVYENKNSLKNLLYQLDNYNFNDVLILGRNNFDINKYLDGTLQINSDGYIFSKNIKNIKIRYLSVHKSKGLEADIVIVLNLTNNKLGFPSKIEINKFLTVFYPKTDFLFAEERRLFYVALTRTKNEVYLLTQKNNSSIFVKELLKLHKKYIEIEKI